MIRKYEGILNDIFEYIRNRLVAGTLPEAIVREVIEKYPTELAYYKVDIDMKYELVRELVAFGYFLYNGESYITP